jgi:hypothetical protein
VRSRGLGPAALMSWFVTATTAGCLHGNAKAPTPPAVHAAPRSDEGQRSDKTGPPSVVGAGPDQQERRTIRVAELTLRVANRRAAEAAVNGEVNALGGHILATQVSDRGSSGWQITFCAPSEKFDGAVAALERLAEGIISRRVNSLDEELVDLETQMHDREGFRARWLTFRDHAVEAADALAAQRTLIDLQGQLDRITRRINLLYQCGTLSALTVHLFGTPL